MSEAEIFYLRTGLGSRDRVRKWGTAPTNGFTLSRPAREITFCGYNANERPLESWIKGLRSRPIPLYSDGPMQPQHQSVFLDVADKYQCWIGLREPNPLAAKWIGRPGCVPKPDSCKAKTSDNPVHLFAGLVVNPQICPDAFSMITRAEALRKWNEFAPAGMLPAGYSVISQGSEKGLVKLRGSSLFADYDLMAINRSNLQGEFLPTSNSEQQSLYHQVAPEINRGLGTPLIQHGAELMWTQGIGGRESEFVLWFGPGRRMERWPSSMPRGGQPRGGH